MNILIVYATYSSGTETATNVLGRSLKNAGNSVEIVNAVDADVLTFKSFDLIIFGSPSWWVNGKQGQPHEHMVDLLAQLDKETFGKAKCAVFGLGHADYYINFCMAVDIIEKTIVEVGGELAIPSLKINEFYFHQLENEKMIEDWTKGLTALQ